MCWSNSGKLILDIPILDIDRSVRFVVLLAPRKDGLDRQRPAHRPRLKRPVLKFKGTPSVTALDKDHLVGRFSEKAEQIDRFTIPWSEIRESLKALESKHLRSLLPISPSASR